MKFRALTSSTLFIALFMLAAFATAAFAQTITTFDVPNSTGTVAQAINIHGEMVGEYFDANGLPHAFLWQKNGSLQSIDLQWDGARVVPVTGFTHYRTIAISLNDSGTMLGRLSLGDFDMGFVRKPNGRILTLSYTAVENSSAAVAPQVEPIGKLDCGDGVIPTSINELGEVTGSVHCIVGLLWQRNGINTAAFRLSLDNGDLAFTAPQAINAKSQIVGKFVGEGSGQDFLRQPDGSYIIFTVPDCGGYPAAINNRGQIAGSCGSSYGFVGEPDGGFILFNPPGSVDTTITGMNGKGEITGFYSTADGVSHGFVREPNGVLESFDAPNAATGTFPQGINKRGEIVGYYQDANSVLHGFVRSLR